MQSKVPVGTFHFVTRWFIAG